MPRSGEAELDPARRSPIEQIVVRDKVSRKRRSWLISTSASAVRRAPAQATRRRSDPDLWYGFVEQQDIGASRGGTP